MGGRRSKKRKNNKSVYSFLNLRRQYWRKWIWSLRCFLSSSLFSLRSKLIAIFSLLFVLILFTVSLLSLNYQKHFMIEEVGRRGELIATNLAMASREALLNRDLLTLSALVGAAQKDKDVAYAYIVDHDDTVIMHSDFTKIETRVATDPETAIDSPADPSGSVQSVRTPEGSSSVVGVSQPIVYGGKVIGEIHVGLNHARVEQTIGRARRRLLETMGLGLFFGVGGVLFLSNLFLRPIGQLVRATQEVANGNLEIWVPSEGRDELGQLGISFNVMTERLKTAYEGLERGYMETTRALAAAVEAKDAYTEGHCLRVSLYAIEVGRRLGFSRSELKELELAATLHDIGKIGIKDDVLMKPTRLSLDEMAMMHLHPEIGKRILEKVEPLRQTAFYVLCHHEFVNGKGYPCNLKGEKIPPISRIITVADAYDAMSSQRSYRGPLPEEEVRKRLLGARGRQFDSSIVDAFIKLYDAGIIQKIKSKFSKKS